MKLFTVRIIKVGCTTSIGEQRKTFTVDENGKQNSPSFDSFNDFCNWKNEVRLYDVRYDLTMTAKNYPNAFILNLKDYVSQMINSDAEYNKKPLKKILKRIESYEKRCNIQ